MCMYGHVYVHLQKSINGASLTYRYITVMFITQVDSSTATLSHIFRTCFLSFLSRIRFFVLKTKIYILEQKSKKIVQYGERLA